MCDDQRRVAALQAAALELRIAGWPYAKIAAVLGVSELTVYRMVRSTAQGWFILVGWNSPHWKLLKRLAQKEMDGEWADACDEEDTVDGKRDHDPT